MYCSPWRKLIIGTDTPMETIYGYVPRVYFNNTATTLVAKQVRDKFDSLLPRYCYDSENNSLSVQIKEEYNNVRNIVLDYVHGDKINDTVIYTKSATEGANILIDMFYKQDPEQIILATRMDHTATYIPLAQKFKVVLVNITSDGNIDMEDYEKKLKKYEGRIKNVVSTAVSNVTGIVNPYYEMARLAHQYGARIFLDVVQLVQHLPFSMKSHCDKEHIDFIIFSAHKCYSGEAGGALVGSRDFFNKFKPAESGAGVYKFLTDEMIIYDEAPARFEPGYPDLVGTICMGESLKLLSNMGLDNISKYEKSLYNYLREELSEVKGITIYAENTSTVGVPVMSFNLGNMSYKTLSKKLGYEHGIAVASGTAGADMYVQDLLGISNREAYDLYITGQGYGIVRVSLGVFNTFEEIDRFIQAMKCISID